MLWIIAIILLFLILFQKKIRESFESMSKIRECNNIDGRCYAISDQFDPGTFRDASERLADVNKSIIKLLRHMRKKYLWNRSASIYENSNKAADHQKMRRITERLISMYDPDNMTENAPLTKINTSFVEDKGKIFALCLREKVTGKNKIEHYNTTMFVTLHELAHIADENWGHEVEFWRVFKLLLAEAVEIGIYKPINYSHEPKQYCGIDITYNPHYDASLD